MKTRALNAIINSEWAMLPDRLRLMLSIAAGEHPGLRAVEAERGEPLEYAYNVTVRDGVAVIPVTGPIFRYANLFTYYSGGTSIGLLARDFNAALSDARVHSILFEINSPGGEITGVNELAQMIYDARGRKPITARVGGLGCSAAYWIASACGDIVIDETAMLGSIGVYAAYLDTKKRDAKEGFREIKIISNQSPDKCPDPATPEGEKQIQQRVDALAQIFVEAVARNRDVTVERVLSDFGKGDVLVGEDAIGAGLADRLGSFEGTVASLAEAHGPARGGGYTGALYAVEDEGAAEEPEPGGDDSAGVKADESEEEEPPSCPDHPGGCPEGKRCGDEEKNSALAPQITEKGTTEMAQEKESAGNDQPTIEQLQAQLAEANERAAASEAKASASDERVGRLEAAARTARLTALAANFTGDIAAKVSFMEKLAASFGEDSDELKAYVADQNAVAEQVKAGGLFREAGSSAAGETNSALDKLDRLAKEKADKEGITYAAAYAAVCEEHKGLYAQSQNQQ